MTPRSPLDLLPVNPFRKTLDEIISDGRTARPADAGPVLPAWRRRACPASTRFAGVSSNSVAGSPPRLQQARRVASCVSPIAGDVELQDDGVVTTRSVAAAVAMGLAKMRSHSEKTRLDVIPSDLRL